MSVEERAHELLERMQKKIADRPSANWRSAADVDWEDLDFFVDRCKVNRDKDSFDTAIRVLTALRSQVLDRK
jgi:hypothetical protein